MSNPTDLVRVSYETKKDLFAIKSKMMSDLGREVSYREVMEILVKYFNTK
ncbi:hypothetical protein LCGC14_1831710, partial [marine sediment metagenome]